MLQRRVAYPCRGTPSQPPATRRSPRARLDTRVQTPFHNAASGRRWRPPNQRAIAPRHHLKLYWSSHRTPSLAEGSGVTSNGFGTAPTVGQAEQPSGPPGSGSGLRPSTVYVHEVSRQVPGHASLKSEHLEFIHRVSPERLGWPAVSPHR